MALSKTAAGWLVDIQPGGRGGRRYRRTLPTKAEALAYEAWLKTKVAQSPEWQPARRDARRLLDLVEIWHRHHGVSLRAGEDTLRRLRQLCQALGNPAADQFKPEMFAAYRARRLAEGISANNLNREHAYLRAVFNELSRLGHWKGGNPLAKVRQMKVAERELSFLSVEQIRRLLDALSGDALLIARLGDALISELSVHLEKRYCGDRANAERFFMSGYGAFRGAVDKCGIALPRGQLTHVLRHTFASHFMMNGGSILVLQKILGHSSLTMTMRYAHLAPDHLREAKALNPLVCAYTGAAVGFNKQTT